MRDTSHLLVWSQPSQSGISDTTGEGTTESNSNDEGTAFINPICDAHTDCDCDESPMGEGVDIGHGYGSISGENNSQFQDKSFREKEGLEDQRSALRTVFQIDEGVVPTIFRRSNHRTEDGVERRRNSTMLQRKRARMVWRILVCLSCFGLAFLGAGLWQEHEIQQGRDGTRFADVFFFDSLFKGIKKKPSKATLEQPPPLARSILLVLRAEAAPANPMVPDIDRQLTAKGMQDADGLGVYLQEHNIPEPDWIFVSPTERTAYTTELMRRHWAADAPVAFEDILYILEFNDYFNFVAGLNDQFRRVMIVGHNPAILNTAKKLMKTHGIEDFPACGLMEIRYDDLSHWGEVEPFKGSSKMAIDPNNNFFFSSPR